MLIYKNNKMVYTQANNRATAKYRKANKDWYNEYQANYMTKRYNSNPEPNQKQNEANLKRYYLQKEFKRFRNILL